MIYTQRRREEKYSKILEYAISQSKTTIWVGRGIDFSEKPYMSKEIIYWRICENSLFWSDIDTDQFSNKELMEEWDKSISEKNKK